MIYPIILANTAAGETVTQATGLPLHFATGPGIESRFQEQLRLFAGLRFAAPLAITATACRLAATAQAKAANPETAFLLEPGCSRPAAAVAAAALRFRDRPGALLLIVPAGHAFASSRTFDRQLVEAIPAAAAGNIVSFAAASGSAALGFGLLDRDAACPDGGVQPAMLYPSGCTLAEAGPDTLLNRGVYLLRAGVLLATLKRCAPRLLQAAKAALAAADGSSQALELGASALQRARPSSVEDAITSRAASLVALDCGPAEGAMQDWAPSHITSPAADPLDLDGGHGANGARLASMRHTDAVLEHAAPRPPAPRGAVRMSAAASHPANQPDAVVRVERLKLQPGEQRMLPAGTAPAHLAVVQGCALLTGQGRTRVLWQDHSAMLPAAGTVVIENSSPGPLIAFRVLACPRGLAPAVATQSAFAAEEAAVYAMPPRDARQILPAPRPC